VSSPLLPVPLGLFPYVRSLLSLFLRLSSYVSPLCLFPSVLHLCLFLSICSLLSLSLRLLCVSPPMCPLPVSSPMSVPLRLSSLSHPLYLFPSVSFHPSLVTYVFLLYISPLSLHLCLIPSASSPLHPYVSSPTFLLSVSSPLSVSLYLFPSLLLCCSSYVSPKCLFHCVSLSHRWAPYLLKR
jgi:hypothetical protein